MILAASCDFRAFRVAILGALAAVFTWLAFAADPPACKLIRIAEWPAPIMLYRLGRVDRAGVMAAANVADDKKRKERECGDECPRNFVGYESALAELRRVPAQ